MSVSCPTSGRQHRLEDNRIAEYTHTCMHVYTEGESVEWLKVTISHIWGAEPYGPWQRIGPGSVARESGTCGTQRGEQTTFSFCL